MGFSAVFKKIDPLPGSQTEHTGFDRDHLGGSCEGHAKVAGGVIGSLQCMVVIGIIFRNDFLKVGMEILPGSWVGIFVDNQTGAGMTDKNGGDAILNARLTNESFYLFGNGICSFAMGSEDKRIRLRDHKWNGNSRCVR